MWSFIKWFIFLIELMIHKLTAESESGCCPINVVLVLKNSVKPEYNDIAFKVIGALSVLVSISMKMLIF